MSSIRGISDDGYSFSDFIASFRNYVESNSTACITLGRWNWPNSDIVLYLEANESDTYEFYLHLDGVRPETRCPSSSAVYVSRVPIGSNWVDVSLPIQ